MLVKYEFIYLLLVNNLKEDLVMTTSYKVCLFISICVVSLFTGYALATVVQPPEFTQDEINYYVQVAKTAWYDGIRTVPGNADILISSNLTDNTVTVTPQRYGGAQSLTINFEYPSPIVTINCTICFWGNVFFYALLFGMSMYGIPYLLKFIKSKKIQKE